MSRAVSLRADFDGPRLRRLAKVSKDAGQSRRLVALAVIYDGGRRTDAARLGDVGLQVIRDWVLRFNAKGPDGLIDGKATGKPRKLDDAQRQALARLVEDGPIPAIHGVVRWRRKDLALWIFEEFGISLEESSVGRELRALGFSKISGGRGTRGRTSSRSRILKKLRGRAGRDPHRPSSRHRHRDLVAGRGPGRPENQAHAALGETRQPAHGGQGPTYEVGLYLWRHLSPTRRRRGPRPAPLQHQGHAMAPR